MSSLVAGGVGAIIGLLVSQGFQSVQAETNRTGDTIISGFDPSGKPIKVQLKNNAVVSPQFDFVRISSTNTTFPNENSPDYELKNESGVIKRIFALTFIPDSAFQAQGILKITLNEAPLFPISNIQAGVFQDTSALNIPIPDTYGLKILPKEKLKIFIADPTASGTISGTIAVFIGELP